MQREPQKRSALAPLLIGLIALLLGLGAVVATSGCEEEIDVTTEAGLKRALEKKEKLGDAMNELKGKSVDDLKAYGKELAKLYIDGSDHDVEVFRYLAQLKDAEYKDAYIKGLKSSDATTVKQAAGLIGELEIAEAVPDLIAVYHSTVDQDLRLSIITIGSEVKNEELSKLAADLLAEKGPDDVPIANLRYACRALEFQGDPKTTATLLRAMFYVDSAGRDINTDCTAAILAIGRPAIPELITMLKLENESVNQYVKLNADRMTEDTVALGATTLLGKLRAKEAVPVLLAHLSDPAPITPPAPLLAKQPGDQAWFEWSNLIGQVTQEMIFALNDIGVEGDEEARRVLSALFAWTEPFPVKYKTAVDYVNMIEVSARVNAARVMAENNMLDDAGLQLIFATLKDKDFDDIRRLRPAARSSIVTDLVTYLSIASLPGWTETVWKYFSEMSANELADNPQIKEKWGFEFDFAPTRERIARVKSTFELADECQHKPECYAPLISDNDPANRFRRIKAAYELGRYGSHEHFELILGAFADFDPFGYMLAADALARLGTTDDVAKVQAQLDKLSEVKSSQSMQFIEGYLRPLKATLRNKVAQ
ncbi:MAG: hypothetical protein AUK47_00945 [Deltaproteobacteria bacterium CG2_30_63_29]|nr:MAG: hypothetical protein AUK47_00945 [Deltaproteobacteria bacterium CG2_30_63_29]PJB33337.1 MAG: hypothetical protein CO108_31070 [Deltaproteobacteria bacterium CG_4_9_14_3_um_filter_63_12]